MRKGKEFLKTLLIKRATKMYNEDQTMQLNFDSPRIFGQWFGQLKKPKIEKKEWKI